MNDIGRVADCKGISERSIAGRETGKPAMSVVETFHSHEMS
jgi:hypothetical protein